MQNMQNKAMERKLDRGETIDVSGFARNEAGDYILPDYADDMDYCDRVTEEWIWSIGRNKATGQVLASTSAKFYQNDEFSCLWLR